MTPPASTILLAHAATLQSIRVLTAVDPRTLDHARTTFQGVSALAVSLRGTEFSTLGEQVEKAASAAAYGDSCAKTLPQAREKLSAIAALLPVASAGVQAPAASSSIPGSTMSDAERDAAAADLKRSVALRMRDRRAAAAAPAKSGALSSDTLSGDALLARYASLKGSDRFAFFQTHRDALIEAEARKADAEKMSLHADVVTQYMSLTGQARADFYEKHQHELWEAHRARASVQPRRAA
jgi:hypothetical protein